MSLNQDILNTIQTFRENFPPELTNLIEQGAGEISAMQIVENALNQGDKAPEFSLLDRKGQTHTLKNYLDNGPLVITFYRGAWCPYCNLQLAAYNAHLNEIKSAGGTLVAVTPETPEGIPTFLNSGVPEEMKASIVTDPDFDVLHDPDNQLGKQFGLEFKLPDAHVKLFELMEFDIEKANGSSSYTFSDPATYIIGTDSFIKWAFVPNNYRKRANPEDIIKQLKAL